MQSAIKTVRLHKGKERSLKLMHPWVFSGAVRSVDTSIREGDIVEVISSVGEFLGIGHYHEGSIKVRIFSFEQTPVSQSFWNDKFLKALRLRKNLDLIGNTETTCYRLVHGEGDGMPGLIVDIYGKAAVIQAHTVGMHALVDNFSEALKVTYGENLTVIYDKSAETLGKNRAPESTNRFLLGDEGQITVKESGISYNIDIIEGQKTGFFLDQRENRNLLRSYSKGKSLLNTFCYSGGFSLAALAGGAETVVSIDSS
ncbi:MAG: class I SAM-dependent rRNA methyltransferase, partial [Bacteroidota bacterium]